MTSTTDFGALLRIREAQVSALLEALPGVIPVLDRAVQIHGKFLESGSGDLRAKVESMGSEAGVSEDAFGLLSRLRKAFPGSDPMVRVGAADEDVDGAVAMDLFMVRKDLSVGGDISSARLRESVAGKIAKDAVPDAINGFVWVHDFVSIEGDFVSGCATTPLREAVVTIRAPEGVVDVEIEQWLRPLLEAWEIPARFVHAPAGSQTVDRVGVYDLVFRKVHGLGEAARKVALREALDGHEVSDYFMISDRKAKSFGPSPPAAMVKVGENDPGQWAIIVVDRSTGNNRASPITASSPVRAIRRTKQEARRLRDPRYLVIGGEKVGTLEDGTVIWKQTQGFSFVSQTDKLEKAVAENPNPTAAGTSPSA